MDHATGTPRTSEEAMRAVVWAAGPGCAGRPTTVLGATIVGATAARPARRRSRVQFTAVEERHREHDRQEQQERVEGDLQQRVGREPVVEKSNHACLGSS
jgi:hypothetical protein